MTDERADEGTHGGLEDRQTGTDGQKDGLAKEWTDGWADEHTDQREYQLTDWLTGRRTD